MTGDLIKWLREEASFAYHRAEEDMLTEAADRIEALEAENERLRGMLEVIRDGDYPYKQASQYAREALGEKQ